LLVVFLLSSSEESPEESVAVASAAPLLGVEAVLLFFLLVDVVLGNADAFALLILCVKGLAGCFVSGDKGAKGGIER